MKVKLQFIEESDLREFNDILHSSDVVMDISSLTLSCRCTDEEIAFAIVSFKATLCQ